jgi:hypothetical protein
VSALAKHFHGAAPFLHKDANGATALMVAAHCANAAATHALLAALTQASSHETEATLRVTEVLEATDSMGATALWLAAAATKPQGGAAVGGAAEGKAVVEALLAAGAGEAPNLVAVEAARVSCVSETCFFFFSLPSDPKGGSPGGTTAQAAAEHNGHADIAALLAANASASQ